MRMYLDSVDRRWMGRMMMNRKREIIDDVRCEEDVQV